MTTWPKVRADHRIRGTPRRPRSPGCAHNPSRHSAPNRRRDRPDPHAAADGSMSGQTDAVQCGGFARQRVELAPMKRDLGKCAVALRAHVKHCGSVLWCPASTAGRWSERIQAFPSCAKHLAAELDRVKRAEEDREASDHESRIHRLAAYRYTPSRSWPMTARTSSILPFWISSAGVTPPRRFWRENNHNLASCGS